MPSPAANVAGGRFLPGLTGAEFKIASYLCGQLKQQEVVGTTISALSRATGVSWRHTQACLQSFAKQGVLVVCSRKGHGTECRLPVAPPAPSETVSPSQPGADNIESVSAGQAQPSAAEVEARNLAAKLLGRPVDDVIMAELQAGVDRHPHRPGALLHRLRELKHRGRRFRISIMDWAWHSFTAYEKRAMAGGRRLRMQRNVRRVARETMERTLLLSVEHWCIAEVN